nr:hypothetical protein [Anaeroplasmataceae bacterium]
AVDYSNSRLSQFCRETGQDYPTYFKTMFQFNRQLQTVNQLMLYLGVISLIALAIMLICSNISRKRYYISNLVSGVAAPAVSGIFAIVVSALCFGCIAPLSDNFVLLNWGSLANDDLRAIKDVIGWYNNNANDTSHFDLSSTSLVLFGVFLIVFALASMAMIAYNVFRYLDTRKELAQEKAVAE